MMIAGVHCGFVVMCSQVASVSYMPIPQLAELLL